MRTTRTLALKRETLTELTAGELGSVAGGSHVCGVTDRCGHGPSIDEACPTVPVTICIREVDLSQVLSCH